MKGSLIEGFVELAAEIIEDGRLDIRGESRKNHCGCGQEAENDTFHVIHTLSVIFSVTHRLAARFTGSHATSARSVFPSRSWAIWHGPKQNSRGILTFWKSMARASRTAARSLRQGRQAEMAAGIQEMPVPLRLQVP
jgi:hypothetical protein